LQGNNPAIIFYSSHGFTEKISESVAILFQPWLNKLFIKKAFHFNERLFWAIL